MIRSSKPAKTSKGVCLDETPKKLNENLQKPPPKASTAKDKAIGISTGFALTSFRPLYYASIFLGHDSWVYSLSAMILNGSLIQLY